MRVKSIYESFIRAKLIKIYGKLIELHLKCIEVYAKLIERYKVIEENKIKN